MNVLLKIIGKFFQTPNDHQQGAGCPRCANNMKNSVEEWIQKFTLVHGNKYNYELIKNVANNKSTVKIICPDHR